MWLAAALLAGCGGGGSSSPEVQQETPPPPPPPAGVLELEATEYTVDESSQTVSFTVTRTGGTNGEVSVEISTADATATAGNDYGAMTTTATFPDGDSGSKSGNVIIFDDDDHESDETISLTLSAVTGGASIGTRSSAVITIVDDDPLGISIGGSVDGLEGDGLVLSNNGEELQVGASEESFRFPTAVFEGDDYDVKVSVQPWAPAQRCEVANGSGTAGTIEITDVTVNCVDVPLQSILISRTVGGQRDLLVVREDGNDLVTIADTVASENFQGFAGDRIIYTADGDIFSILPNGSDRIVLAGEPEIESIGGIGGAGLVFFERRAGLTAATDDLYAIGADGTGLTPLAFTPDDEEYAGFVDDADDGRVIYRRTVGSQDDLYSVRPDGSETLSIAHDAAFEEYVTSTQGGRILFYRVDGDRALYSVNPDGTALAGLGTEPGEHQFVRLLDEERLVYRHEPSPGQYDLFAVNADGTAQSALANTTVPELLAGITASGRVVFERLLSGHKDIFAVDDDGTSLATLAATPFTEGFAGALPDGRVLYLRSDAAQPDLTDIFIVNADGTNTAQLTDTPEPEFVAMFVYTANNRLIFSRSDGGMDDLYSMALDGTDVRQLTDTPDADEIALGVTPSGGIVYLSSSNGQSDVYRIGVDGNGFAVIAATGEQESVAEIF
ncbi:MAG TPA: Calx-beta domain-containing protein [Woeseiaceae bacterium]|nr:Calx-beta domain-containing protein [Woeseiaceae bacterium]